MQSSESYQPVFSRRNVPDPDGNEFATVETISIASEECATMILRQAACNKTGLFLTGCLKYTATENTTATRGMWEWVLGAALLANGWSSMEKIVVIVGDASELWLGT